MELNKEIPQAISDLAEFILTNKEFTINDWDLDRVYLDVAGDEYDIRMWNITDVDIRWTLFKIIDDGDGSGHGEEVSSGVYDFK